MLSYDIECPPISGEIFTRLINLCFRRSEYFSFSIHNMPNTDNTLQHNLNSYIYYEIFTSHWFSYITLPENPMKIIVYHANRTTQTILEKYCHRLFLFDNECSSVSWIQNLEDLCFFSKDKLILGTVSHEYICEVFPPDDAFKNDLLNIYAHWKETTDSTEQIKLSSYL